MICPPMVKPAQATVTSKAQMPRILLDVGARSHLLLQNESSVTNSPEVLATSLRLMDTLLPFRQFALCSIQKNVRERIEFPMVFTLFTPCSLHVHSMFTPCSLRDSVFFQSSFHARCQGFQGTLVVEASALLIVVACFLSCQGSCRVHLPLVLLAVWPSDNAPVLTVQPKAHLVTLHSHLLLIPHSLPKLGSQLSQTGFSWFLTSSS